MDAATSVPVLGRLYGEGRQQSVTVGFLVHDVLELGIDGAACPDLLLLVPVGIGLVLMPLSGDQVVDDAMEPRVVSFQGCWSGELGGRYWSNTLSSFCLD